MEKKLFTSESVTEGHPDKVCDQISDAILDAILKDDPNARVACETTVTTGLVLVTGEITTIAYAPIQEIVRKTLTEIGYTRSKFGFDAENVSVLVSIDPQSPDIAQGVNEKEGLFSEQGAGDQGLMFGYATDETDEYMPITAVLSHKLTKQLAEVRKNKTLSYLRPDGKSQVTVEFDKSGKPLRVHTIVVSSQHAENIEHSQIVKDIKEHVIMPMIPNDLLDEETNILINPTGKFVIGGPKGDAGLTGRKIIVDTYGGYARHGGGAFSGKDPSKVDRSAAYAARYVAKNIVAAGLASKCEIQLSYAIGVADPINVSVDTFGTNKISEDLIAKAIRENFGLKPREIIEALQLKRPIYRQTATYGHFGRNDLDLPWEKLDKVEALQEYLCQNNL